MAAKRDGLFLGQWVISLSGDGHALAQVKEKIVEFDFKTVHGVFNDGRFDHGGRYYGPWWQNVRKELRPHILINGIPTHECDYTALHIHLLYGLEADICQQETTVDR